MPVSVNPLGLSNGNTPILFPFYLLVGIFFSIFHVTDFSVYVKLLSRVRPCNLMDYSLPHSSVHGIFQARVLEWGAISFSRGSPQPRDRTWVSQIADILPSEPPGKPKKVQSGSRSVVSDSLRPHGLYSAWNSPGQNTGVGSLSLLQGIIPTQGSNPGLLHCRGFFTS